MHLARHFFTTKIFFLWHSILLPLWSTIVKQASVNIFLPWTDLETASKLSVDKCKK